MPACVQNCPTHALLFGDPYTLSDRRRQRQADSLLHRRFPESSGTG
jgi:Fe-S-cluster-containing dehydrogenase component